MVNISSEVANDILSRSTPILAAKTAKIYKESLEQLRNIFGNMYYINANGEAIKLKCITGNPERVIAKKVKDTTMVLPLLSVTEISTNQSDDRNRYSQMLSHDKYWDPKTLRAVRLLSLVPKPISISYQLNIWTEYKEDMDQIRSSVFLMFNPHLEIRTSDNDIAKCFIDMEEDNSVTNAGDQEDRLIKKAIHIKLETYISSPKFVFTSTGKIETFHLEAELTNDMSVINSKDTFTISLEEINDRLRYLRNLASAEQQSIIDEIIRQIMALTTQI